MLRSGGDRSCSADERSSSSSCPAGSQDRSTRTSAQLSRAANSTTLRLGSLPDISMTPELINGQLRIEPIRVVEVHILKQMTWCYVIDNPGLATRADVILEPLCASA